MSLALKVPLLLIGAYSFGLAWCSLGIGLSRPEEAKLDSVHWIERARLLHPARAFYSTSLVWVPFALGFAVALLEGTSGVPRCPWASVAALAGYLGAAGAVDRLERVLLTTGSVDRGTPPSGICLHWLLIFPQTLALAATFAFLPLEWNLAATISLTAGIGVLGWILLGGFFPLLRHAGLLRPASSRLLRVVESASIRAGCPVPVVYELDSPESNALAWIFAKVILFTRPLLGRLDDEELGAITSHELGHLHEPWVARVTRAVVALLMIAAISGVPLIRNVGLWVVLPPFAAYLFGVLVFQRVSRRMEVRSDQFAARQAEGSELALARALEKIHQANSLPVVFLNNKRMPHPDLYDRLLANGWTPAYERPEPPPHPRVAEWSLVLLASGIILLAIFTTEIPPLGMGR